MKFPSRINLSLLLVLLNCLFVNTASAQERPDRKFLFLEDRELELAEQANKRKLKERESAARASQSLGTLPFDVNAETIDFGSSGETITATGNVVFNYSTMLLEADKGSFHIPTNQCRVEGDVRISDLSGELTATEAVINFKTGEASLNNSEIYFLDGNYQVKAKQIARSSQDRFNFKDAALSTCRCPEGDDCNPWQLSASDAEITKDGYGKVWNATLDVHDVPVLYIPYLIFPAKTTRQTGFLPMRIGSGGNGELELEVPFFLTLGRSADLTITPLLETETRYGVRNEFRAAISEQHSLTAGFVYTDETLRNGDLRGTVIDELDDPNFDDDRTAAYIDHSASFQIGQQPFQYIFDGNYVSDDLVLRELDLFRIGDERSRFVTSNAVIRTPLFDTYSLDLSAEFNQALVDDDDFVFQRLPELGFSGFSVFRPFGQNPYGLKLVTNSDFTATNFSRVEDFDGLRLNAFQRFSVPFHYKNYFDASVGADVHLTKYTLDSEPIEREEDDELFGIEDSSERAVPGFDAEISTIVEKVTDVEEGSFIKNIAELGRIGRDEKLVRMRHSIQPIARYRYVPLVNQSDTPQFDSVDRLENKNFVTFELVQRWDGRFEPRNEDLYGFEELTPEVTDLENLELRGPVDPDLTFGAETGGRSQFSGLRRGSRVELLTLKLGQTVDIDEEINDRTDEDSYSDTFVEATVSPNEYVRFTGRSNIDISDQDLSSYSLLGQFTDKRGDELRAQLRFVEDSVRQLETGVQLLITDSLKLGYYGRYDDLNSEFLENRVGLRVVSECNCWIFDVEAIDRINPNRTTLAFTMTLVGIGEFGTDFFSTDEEDNFQ